jgi:para-aminobenzoate synthetase component 1
MKFREIAWRDPCAAFAPFDGVPWAHLLHGGDRALRARWSVIVADPAHRIEARDGRTTLDGRRTAEPAFVVLDDLQRSRARQSREIPADAPPFAGGLIGFAGYESAREFEPTLGLPASPLCLPDLAFGAYEAAAAFDRIGRRAWLAATSHAAGRRLEAALGCATLAPVERPREFADTCLTSNFDRASYQGEVTRIRELIAAGGLFQANIAQTLTTVVAPATPLTLFRMLARSGDAALAALLQFDTGAIVSMSPERFFALAPGSTGQRIVVEPIKGTRARLEGTDDEQVARDLIEDPKERAENVMIADLMRNDLSIVCADHSITEEAICELMTLDRVHHLVSRISGTLRAGIGLRDVFAALFPSGSITGAPKIAAMQAIATTERLGRGPYCGAIGYWSDNGKADFSVAIRSLVAQRTAAGVRLTYGVGGGITLRSDPAHEYAETLAKASGVFGASVLASLP